MEESYIKLAERNGWSYSLIDGKPYFMKDGNYAIPDDTTTEEDKELLANILSEGSSEMAQIIILCWNNGIIISGPCSGIKEFHDKPPLYLHFSFMASKDLIEPLCINLQKTFPTFEHKCRENNNLIRYDINYFLNGKELTTNDSNKIFSIIKKELQAGLDNLITKIR